MSGLRAGQSMNSTSCIGRGIVLDVHKVTFKHPCHPLQHLISQDLDVTIPVHVSIHHDQLTPPPTEDCTPYHDWQATISIIRLDTGINQPFPLPMAHPDPTVTVVEGGPGLITEDTVSSFSKVPHSVPPPHSRRRRLCSKVRLGHLAGCRD